MIETDFIVIGSAPAGGVRALRLAAWLTPLVLGIMGWRYLGLIAEAATDPPYRGNNLWLLVWTSAAVIVMITIALAPKHAFLVWRIAIAGSAAAIIVLSGAFAAALIALWLMVIAVLLGDRLVSGLQIRPNEYWLERFALALPIGFVAFAFAAFGLAVSGLFKPAYVWSLMVVLSALEARHAVAIVRRVRDSLRAPSLPERESYVVVVLTGLVVSTNLIWAVAPEIEYDSLNYHLAVPRFYLDSGRLIDLPYFFHSYFAHLPDFFFGWCMALHGAMTAKLANFGLGVASMLAVFCLGELVFSRRVALWAAALYYTTPLTGWLTGTAYTDLLVGYLIAASLIAFLQWRRTKQPGWIAVCALLAGGSIGVKLNAMFAVFGLGLAVAGILLRATEPAMHKSRTAMLFGVLMIFTAVPWYLPAYFYTGNPVFPLFNGVFKSPRAEPVNTLMGSETYGVGTSLHALIELPARLTFNPRFGTKPGTLGMLALFCAPFGIALLFLRRNVEARFIAFVGGVFMVFWIASYQSARYYMAVFPIVSVLGAAGVLRFYHTEMTERVTRMMMLILLVEQAALFSCQYTNLPERIPLHVALGLETREAFLTRAVAGYKAAQQINMTILPGQRVLGVDTEHVRLYLKPPIDVLSETMSDHPLRSVGGSDAEIAQGLHRIGYAYLLVTRQAMRFPQPWDPYIMAQFLDRFARLEYEDEEVALFRLKDGQ